MIKGKAFLLFYATFLTNDLILKTAICIADIDTCTWLLPSLGRVSGSWCEAKGGAVHQPDKISPGEPRSCYADALFPLSPLCISSHCTCLLQIPASSPSLPPSATGLLSSSICLPVTHTDQSKANFNPLNPEEERQKHPTLSTTKLGRSRPSQMSQIRENKQFTTTIFSWNSSPSFVQGRTSTE